MQAVTNLLGLISEMPELLYRFTAVPIVKRLIMGRLRLFCFYL